MITQTVYISDCDWRVYIFYDVTPQTADKPLDYIYYMRCPKKNLIKAERLLKSGKPNQGLTYSDSIYRETVIAIGHADDVFEFFNTLSHEQQHLEQAICKADNLDPYGEDIAYVSGAITEAIARNAWLMARKLFLYLI